MEVLLTFEEAIIVEERDVASVLTPESAPIDFEWVIRRVGSYLCVFP